MARKRYIRDYRIVETVDERGRIRSDYEYIGKHYVYLLDAETVRREKRRALLCVFAGWAAFIAALVPNAAPMRAVYAALPFLCAAIPLGLLTDILLTAVPADGPLNHRQADMLENRYPAAALWSAILPAAAIAGAVVKLFRDRTFSGGDAVFLLAAAVMTGAGLRCSVRRGRFACREL